KVNVGLFVGLAFAACAARARLLRVLVFAAGLALPWVLMRARVDELEVVALALASNVAWATAHGAKRRTDAERASELAPDAERDPAAPDVRVFAGAALVCALAILLWLTTLGTSIGALTEAVIVAP